LLKKKITMKKENKNKPGSGITVDPSLDRYSNTVLFEEKVEAVTVLLSKAPLPKAIKK